MFARHIFSGSPVLADPHRERGVHVELARLAGANDQLLDGDLAQHVTSTLRLAHVTPDQPGIGAADRRDRLARREMDDFVLLQTVVRLAPAEHW
jgi:hypothetical protein